MVEIIVFVTVMCISAGGGAKKGATGYQNTDGDRKKGEVERTVEQSR